MSKGMGLALAVAILAIDTYEQLYAPYGESRRLRRLVTNTAERLETQGIA